MKAKRSAVLLVGVLLLGMLVVWSQTSDVKRPVCPPLEDHAWQVLLEPSAWVRADWNANARQWEIRCDKMDSDANIAVSADEDFMNMNGANRPRPAANMAANANYSPPGLMNTAPRKAPVKRKPHEEE